MLTVFAAAAAGKEGHAQLADLRAQLAAEPCSATGRLSFHGQRADEEVWWLALNE